MMTQDLLSCTQGATMSTSFVKKTAERMGKTFLQFFFGAWMLKAGLLGTELAQPGIASFDLLFTVDNAKAGVVGLALSLATSLGTKNIGPDPDSPSMV